MLVGYIAMSLDGFVAAPDGAVGFLDPFNDADYGYEAFLAEIDAVVMGRATYDQILGFGPNWPYPGKTAHVVTSSELDAPPEGVARWSASLADYAATMDGKKSWVVGGARLQAGFLDEGLIGRLDLFVMPVLLGRGIPLFPHDGPPLSLKLMDQKSYANGALHLTYEPAGHV